MDRIISVTQCKSYEIWDLLDLSLWLGLLICTLPLVVLVSVFWIAWSSRNAVRKLTNALLTVDIVKHFLGKLFFLWGSGGEPNCGKWTSAVKDFQTIRIQVFFVNAPLQILLLNSIAVQSVIVNQNLLLSYLHFLSGEDNANNSPGICIYYFIVPCSKEDAVTFNVFVLIKK